MAEGSRKRSRIAVALEKAQSAIEEQKESLDEAIEELNKLMRPYEALKDERDKLVKARNALSGGSALTGAGGTRLSWLQIAEFVEKNPGSTPEEIATHFNVKLGNVNSALYRQKESFVSKNGKYYRRDPEAGINTAEDIDEDE